MTTIEKLNNMHQSLTPTQQSHYGSIQWFFDDTLPNRQTGRTYALAVWMIQKSYHSMQKMYFKDHDYHANVRTMRDQVTALLKKFGLKFSMTETWFRVNNPAAGEIHEDIS